MAWAVRTAKDAEAPVVPELLDAMLACGFDPETMTADKGYDVGPLYETCEARGGSALPPGAESCLLPKGCPAYLVAEPHHQLLGEIL